MIKSIQSKKYTNHFFENNTLYRGQRQKSIVKPNKDGKYKVKHKGSTYFEDLKEILFGKDEEVEEPNLKVEVKDIDYCLIINNYLNEVKLFDAHNGTNASYSEVAKIYNDIDRAKNIRVLCQIFKISYVGLKTKYNITNSKELDKEDRLRLIQRYIHDKGKSRTSICASKGISYGNFSNWCTYRKLDLTDDSFENLLNQYEEYLSSKNKLYL